jgi:hypothetical protein
MWAFTVHLWCVDPMHWLAVAAISIPAGVFYANLIEFLIHRYLLHGLGKNRASFWSFHWHDHHQEARKQNMFDSQYVQPLFTWGSPQLKEAASVAAITLAHGVLLPFFPIFGAVVMLSGARYYYVHRRAHMDHEWGKRRVPWHYDHHMGKDQNANWCATSPWFDILIGTRKVYSYDESGKSSGERSVSLLKLLSGPGAQREAE